MSLSSLWDKNMRTNRRKHTIHHPEPPEAKSEASTTGEYINLFQQFPIPMMIPDIGPLSTWLESERPRRDISPS